MVEFISYDGEYPCLCSGDLVVRIDGKEVDLGSCLCSGGNVWFDDWRGYADFGKWSVDVPEEYAEYTKEITRVVNENVEWGCCGGCI